MKISPELEPFFSAVNRQFEAVAASTPDADPLSSAEKGDTYTVMVDQTREEVDAKIAASELRGQLLASEITSKFQLISQKLDDVRQGQRTSLWGTIGAVVAAAAVILGAFAFGGDSFNTGRELGAQLSGIERRLDAMAASSAPTPQQPSKPPT